VVQTDWKRKRQLPAKERLQKEVLEKETKCEARCFRDETRGSGLQVLGWESKERGVDQLEVQPVLFYCTGSRKADYCSWSTSSRSRLM
jgi:hypothetical protein